MPCSETRTGNRNNARGRYPDRSASCRFRMPGVLRVAFMCRASVGGFFDSSGGAQAWFASVPLSESFLQGLRGLLATGPVESHRFDVNLARGRDRIQWCVSYSHEDGLMEPLVCWRRRTDSPRWRFRWWPCGRHKAAGLTVIFADFVFDVTVPPVGGQAITSVGLPVQGAS